MATTTATTSGTKTKRTRTKAAGPAASSRSKKAERDLEPETAEKGLALRMTLPDQMRRSFGLGERVTAFRWYGGKNAHLGWLLPLLPVARVGHFVETHGGSAAVLLNRPRATLETYNDLDHFLVTFFRVLRDNYYGRAGLLASLALTPYSREEYEEACEEPEGSDEVDTARRFLVRTAMRFGGGGNEAMSSVSHRSSWRYERTPQAASAAAIWAQMPERLAQVAQRLQGVQVECKPAVDIVQRYDSADTLFYVDPPYDLTVRGPVGNDHRKRYKHEYDEKDHRALAAALHRCRGRVAISGYASPLYADLYGDWARIDVPVMARAATGGNTERVESLWINYSPLELPVWQLMMPLEEGA